MLRHIRVTSATGRSVSGACTHCASARQMPFPSASHQMEKLMTRRFKISALTLIFATTALLASACGSYKPVEQGSCNDAAGREWVPPSEDPETGDPKAGYCK